jgi:thioredoxin-like negative regulator of GroEL
MRLTSRLVIAAFAASLSLPALAATEAPFTQPAFAAAQKAGQPVLVHVTAPWCPVCAKQKPILSTLLAEPKYKDLMVFDVDFDSQKDVLHAFGVQKQSTLIAFHGESEKARSTGETDGTAIQGLVAKTVE